MKRKKLGLVRKINARIAGHFSSITSIDTEFSPIKSFSYMIIYMHQNDSPDKSTRCIKSS